MDRIDWGHPVTRDGWEPFDIKGASLDDQQLCDHWRLLAVQERAKRCPTCAHRGDWYLHPGKRLNWCEYYGQSMPDGAGCDQWVTMPDVD